METGQPNTRLTEKSIRNFSNAKAWGRTFGRVSVVIQPWTEWTRFIPSASDNVVDWWERDWVVKVRICRFYWLRFGIAVYWEVGEDEY